MRPASRSENAQLVRDILLAGLAMVSVAIGLYSLSQGDDPFTWLDAVDIAIVAIFWIDYIQESRRIGWKKYLRTHWWELQSLVPPIPAFVTAFPPLAILRVVRILRLVRVLSVILRLRPLGSIVVRVARRARVDIIFGVGAIVVVVGTLLAYALESHSNPEMASYGEALWFSFNMFTNVAYLDFQPATIGGRIVAGLLQLSGIAFIGIFTASIAGAIVQENRRDEGEP